MTNDPAGTSKMRRPNSDRECAACGAKLPANKRHYGTRTHGAGNIYWCIDHWHCATDWQVYASRHKKGLEARRLERQDRQHPHWPDGLEYDKRVADWIKAALQKW